MNTQEYNLAIETSSCAGSVTLGRGAEVVETVELGEQRRHGIELMPAIDRLFQAHNADPIDLGVIFVSHGPGSFTGLRVGITTAKTLAHVTGAALVAVPTLDVIAENAPGNLDHLAVLLNAKSGRWFTGLYERRDGRLQRTIDPTLMTAEQLLDAAPRPLTILGDFPGDFEWPIEVNWLDTALARPRSEVVHRLGVAMLKAGETVNPLELTPLYIRLPDAEEIWQAKQTAKAS